MTRESLWVTPCSRPVASKPFEATMWKDGVPTDLGVGAATAINSSGQVAGSGAPGPPTDADPGGTSQGWFWSEATGRILVGTLTNIGENSIALGIDDNGTVVGQGYASGGPSKQGFTWRQDTGIQGVPSMSAIYGIHALSTNGSAGSSAMAGTTTADNRAVLVTIVAGLPVITDLGALQTC